MVLISNHYCNFKGLKITNESDPSASKWGEGCYNSGSEAMKVTKNIKYVSQIQKRWRKKSLVLAKVEVHNPTATLWKKSQQ
jgi:hypothetical protein